MKTPYATTQHNEDSDWVWIRLETLVRNAIGFLKERSERPKNDDLVEDQPKLQSQDK
jgi:hypothetical protein